jgi:hypothetical protein
MAAEVERFTSQPDALVLHGRVLYPRFLLRNAGLTSSTPWPSYAPREYPRLGFLLINQNVKEVVLPIKGSAVEDIHAHYIILLGCQREAHVEARLVLDPQEDTLFISSFGLEPCSQ